MIQDLDSESFMYFIHVFFIQLNLVQNTGIVQMFMFKGKVSQDFRPLFIFIKQSHLGP
jgi:hypothetical protein